MNKKALLIAAVAVALVSAAAVAWWQQRQNGGDALQLYGNVDIRQVQLAFRQAGRLATMSVDEGDHVAAGDPLAELDAQPYLDQLAVTEAQVRAAEAELAKLRAGNRPQQIAQAQEEVRRARAVHRNAQQDYERQSQLLKKDSTSQRVVDAALAARDQAAAQLAAAKEALSLATDGARQEDIAAAEARLAAAEAARDQARTALADTRLVAPADAVVLSRVLEPGSMVASSSPVFILSLRDPLYVRAYVGETALGRVAPGTTVELHTDSSDKVYHGQIGFVSPTAEFTPKTVETRELRTDLVYRLRIVVQDADSGLRQGMPVTIQLNDGRSRGW